MTLREQMQREQQLKTLFEQAQNYAFDYADHVLTRNVFPTEQALADLAHFDEELPKTPAMAQPFLKSCIASAPQHR